MRIFRSYLEVFAKNGRPPAKYNPGPVPEASRPKISLNQISNSRAPN